MTRIVRRDRPGATERVGDGGKWGKWVIRVADFVVDKGIPTLRNTRTFTPGANHGYYESNDFMPGDRCPSQPGGALTQDCPNITERERTELAEWLACEKDRPHTF